MTDIHFLMERLRLLGASPYSDGSGAMPICAEAAEALGAQAKEIERLRAVIRNIGKGRVGDQIIMNVSEYAKAQVKS